LSGWGFTTARKAKILTKSAQLAFVAKFLLVILGPSVLAKECTHDESAAATNELVGQAAKSSIREPRMVTLVLQCLQVDTLRARARDQADLVENAFSFIALGPAKSKIIWSVHECDRILERGLDLSSVPVRMVLKNLS
jgi:hypothetical protein